MVVQVIRSVYMVEIED